QTEISAEKESALRDIRRQVALLSVGVAEKVLRKKLSDENEQRELVNKFVDEMTSADKELLKN
ncbi:MAG: F0F1 ATP synthase subunit B, partial [Bacteroidales bacterium]|nr:F0F1 ATP synthase subunit B [Bacteroidales bacterium]MDY6385451.1 F0F1 ATP synthase subunit B [Bacteroidales bacterium]